ncbi:Fe-S cluster assembly protein SufD [Azospirillum sp. ST 5-10]|uniref:Fe-S cluster assembly protein SufD n=1 Tax=unclassified Azospirillum TaxID=2630922 RepID=UPI003F4A6FC1
MTTTRSTRTGDTEAAKPFLEPFERLQGELPGAALSWVRDLREQGRDRFAALGLPTVRQEAWKYTNLRPLEKTAFRPATAAAAGAHFDVLPTVRAGGTPGARLVFLDGRLRADLSSTAGLPDGVELLGLADALSSHPELVGERLGRLAAVDEHALVALNTAYLADGAMLRIPRGVAVAEPIELVFVSLGADDHATSFHPRTLIVAEPQSRATVVEHHIGLGGTPTFANHVAEIEVGEGATLHHYKVQREHADSFHTAHTAARVCRSACYDNFILTAGARLSRNEVRTVLDGEGGTCRVSGAYLVNGEQHCDTTTLIDHAKPHCTSREVYKGAIDDRARAVFQGKIIVRPDAQKTDGHQLNRALLLSDTAEIDAKPELEIYADDVKCSHGATAGELDDEALFYLRSRGIPREEARGLLIASFLAEAIDEIPEEPVREAFQAVVTHWLATRRGGTP